MKNAVLGVVGVSLLGLVCGIVGCGPKGDPGVTGAGLSKEDAMNRLQVVNDLKQMGIASQAFSDNNRDTFPPADGAGTENPFDKEKPRKYVGLSVRVHLLGFMTSDRNQPGQERDILDKLGDNKYTLAPGAPPNDRWNIPELKSIQLSMLSNPVQGKTAEPWLTYYRVFIGNGAAFEPGKQLTSKDFTDGLDKTLLIVEAGEAVPWPKPEELAYDPAKPLPKLGGLFPDGFYAAFADGTVRFIKNGTDEKLIRAMITRNGGEKITELPPKVDTNALRKAADLK